MVMVEVLKGSSLLASGVVIAVICSLLQFQAGVRADLNQTGGQLSPVLLVGILIGFVVSAVGAIQLFQCYERWVTASASRRAKPADLVPRRR
ncbi:hypothetical protein C5C36_16130 [Rathayibacter sp. AY1G1]|nr:hypothetical protein C5C30_17140 [Rathayibacter sp. AY2B5]PPH08578.1 hypothetical protein C5C36_16130 [Rathayibacter sp. AY1G1]PPH85112.1 hypothetical protein C5C64_17000 [Rathayibacter sp. AY1D3]PPH95983.1 hypothetical protein C5C95_14915 [Rathayibacter sp. AY1B7]PPI10874.1 hypothetical protein C5D04_13750 [Rathayibacter sp. AY1D2]PPI28611.1 hypothetical protein C5D66_14320 [Rathayibacter sp. AY1B4]